MKRLSRLGTAIAVASLIATATAASASAYIPALRYITSYTTYRYKAAPTYVCQAVLQRDSSRASDPLGCRYRIALRRTFYADAITGWTWGAHTVWQTGPFGAWRAECTMLYHYNGRSVVVDDERPSKSYIWGFEIKDQVCSNRTIMDFDTGLQSGQENSLRYVITFGISGFTSAQSHWVKGGVRVDGSFGSVWSG